MGREQTLIETFVGLADTLVDDYDVIDFMQTLAERSVDLLDVSAAGIMLADSDGRLRHTACSSEEMRLVELLELQVEEGPCFDAFRDQAIVVSDSAEDAARRWPRFAPRAHESGYITVSAVPMRLRTQVIGALNLFSSEARAQRGRPRCRPSDGRHRHDRDLAGASDPRPERLLLAARDRARITDRDRAGQGNRGRTRRHQCRPRVRSHPDLYALAQSAAQRHRPPVAREAFRQGITRLPRRSSRPAPCGAPWSTGSLGCRRPNRGTGSCAGPCTTTAVRAVARGSPSR